MKATIRIATRKSELALWQANFVKQQLLTHCSSLQIELVEVVSEGDKNTTDSLINLGGKALFVKALQQVVLDNRADIAVHSIKDMSVFNTQDLTLAAICLREDARDAWLSPKFNSLTALSPHAIVGTASPRRQSLALHINPKLQINVLRGNVNTRLKKLFAEQYDGIILASAGLKRLQKTKYITQYLDPEQFIPAIGQGAIGVECRTEDNAIKNLLANLHHLPTAICVNAERCVNQQLGGNCHTPIGAYATINNNELTLRAMVGSLDGQQVIRVKLNGDINQPQQLSEHVIKQLLNQGAKELLNV